ncbi:MAG: uroporphyrinogen-III synthase, partial [Actinomycetota bacterium]|nr:uroporphyrinogen-III synthase [Actinomycetota bacterium]
MAAATTRGAGSRPLLGFRVGIAAHRGSQEQADALRRAGAEPVLGAVLGPVPSARIEALEAVTEDLLARPPSVVVLTSAAGIEGWL